MLLDLGDRELLEALESTSYSQAVMNVLATKEAFLLRDGLDKLLINLQAPPSSEQVNLAQCFECTP